ncbi:histidine phosphatase family protein [Roseospira goensis]|uniref:Phosphohistidine phosphatase SixA n=1 Tax=Roseospira goensis TaxID=391922 RepID=A0A7W6S294_9PROT|nr:histidine phosphatase family protein [Roseospira goensis]MBB4287585.1 phosphohistidine phosphatase SixA [Roseospira goensis]
MRPLRILCLLLLLSVAPAAAARAEADPAALWQALAGGGHVALMRHALAPGTGDPMRVVIGDCATQRNLDDVGRAQARATGDAFRAHGIDRAVVLTSQWCRCRETAALLDLGPPEDVPALNSFFADRSKGPAQLDAVRAFLENLGTDAPPHVLVTHQVVVTGLTDVFPRSGEIVVLRLTDGDGPPFIVAGRIPAF